MADHIIKDFHPRFIFFDLDGTLVSHTIHDVPDSTRQAICQLQDKGIPCALATGRHLMELDKLPGHDIPFDAYVMMNGQMIHNKDRVLIDGLTFQKENLAGILDIFHGREIPIEIMEENRVYINFVNQHVIKTLGDVSTEAPEEMSYEGGDIFMAVSFIEEKDELRLKDMLPDCRITRWHPGGVDIISKGGGKAAGIRRFLSARQIDMSEVIVFGDSENDVDMLKAAGLGIAMGNATPDAIEAADYVTESVDEDGIYKALQHFHIL